MDQGRETGKHGLVTPSNSASTPSSCIAASLMGRTLRISASYQGTSPKRPSVRGQSRRAGGLLDEDDDLAELLCLEMPEVGDHVLVPELGDGAHGG